MDKRWLRWTAIAASAVLVYAALGFWAAPWALQKELTSFAREKLHRQASAGAIRFNPFTLRLEADGLRLAEADGAPLLSVGHLAVEMQWRSFVSRAWRFTEIEFASPKANLVISPDGRFNFAELVDSFPGGHNAAGGGSMPRLVIERLAMRDGLVDLQDRHAGYADTFSPIAFELANFSTLADQSDTHTFTAGSAKGGKLRWTGKASVNPILASGEFVVENASLPELSVYLKPLTKATVAAGRLSATVPYSLSYADGKFEARLLQAKLALQDVALAGENRTDAFASLSNVSATGVDADLVRRELAIAEVQVKGGKLAVRRDAQGSVDLARLMAQAADPAPPARPVNVPASDWKLGIARVSVEQVALAAVDETVSPPLKVAVGGTSLHFGAQAARRGGKLDVTLSQAAMAMEDIAIAKGGQAPVQLARLRMEGGTLDLAARRGAIGKVALEGGQAQIVRDRKGELNLAGWVPKTGDGAPAGDPPSASDPAWSFQADSIEAGKLDFDLVDEASRVKVHLTDGHARLQGAGTDLGKPVKFDAGLKVREGGQLDMDGTAVPATGAVQAKVKVARLALQPLQPLLSRYVKLKIASGSLSAQGTVATGGGARGKPAVRYDGSVDVAGLVLNELDNALFGSWRNAGAARLTATASPNLLEIPELRVRGADAKLIIEDDRSFNAARLLVKQPAASTPRVAAAGAPEAFPVRVRRLRFDDAKLDFTDLSLRPQFSARIFELKGVVNGLSSSQAARSQVELDGRVDDFGLARIRGELNPFAPKNNTDLNVVFRNVDMVPASPYSMKFAGYRIAEGKISLDLQYKVREGRLEGDNKIVIDRLTLGERVESPDALKIPLQLAIAVLKDSNGRIDLGLPVSGDLNDPQVSYGAIIWKAVANVLTRIVTAPFRALGGLLGISGEKLESVTFDAGSGKLLPPEREKLQQIAQLLAKRAGLNLSVPGQYSPAADGAALRALAVRREVARRADIKLEKGEEPGPLDIGDRAVRSALRELYAQRFGDAELAKAKKSAEAAPATPAAAGASQPLAAGAALPVWQRVGKLIQGEPQVADATAFYRALRERLEREQPLAPDALTQLGTERARVVVAALTEAGVDASRVAAAQPQATDTPVGQGVPLKLELASREARGLSR